MARYRQRITTLLRVNSRQVSLRRNQLLVVRLEIITLKETIRSMRRELIHNNIDVPAPSFGPWELSILSYPVTWVVSSFWESRYPGQVPDFNPNLSIEEEVPSEPMS